MSQDASSAALEERVGTWEISVLVMTLTYAEARALADEIGDLASKRSALGSCELKPAGEDAE